MIKGMDGMIRGQATTIKEHEGTIKELSSELTK